MTPLDAAPSPPPIERPRAAADPDAEALRLALRFVERARVARSLARIVAVAARETALGATARVISAPELAPLRQLALAAADSARHVAREEIARVLAARPVSGPATVPRDGADAT